MPDAIIRTLSSYKSGKKSIKKSNYFKKENLIKI